MSALNLEDYESERCGELFFLPLENKLIYVCSDCDLKFYNETDFVQHLQFEIEYEDSLDGDPTPDRNLAGEKEGDSELADNQEPYVDYLDSSWSSDEDVEENGVKFDEAAHRVEVERSETNINEKTTKSSTSSDAGVCPHCKKYFQNVRRHVILVHDRVFQCPDCDKQFPTSFKLKIHSVIHSNLRRHKCTQCDRTFNTATNLRTHLRRHAGDKPHACTECKKTFISRSELKSHTRQHTGEMPFVCEQCGKRFRTSGQMTTHMKRHTQEKNHECAVCQRRFYDSCQLRDHMTSHSGERPHSCPNCSAKFGRRKTLRQHMRLHSDVKAYTCTVCGKSFAQKPGLLSHLKTHQN